MYSVSEHTTTEEQRWIADEFEMNMDFLFFRYLCTVVGKGILFASKCLYVYQQNNLICVTCVQPKISQIILLFSYCDKLFNCAS
jgi:hypothetical protein